MQFLTFEFYLFFVAVLFFLFPIRGYLRVYKIYLLGVSIFFYYLFGIDKLIILIIFSLINYLTLLSLKFFNNKNILRFLFIFGVLANIFFLSYYKYTNFLSDTVSEIWGFNLNIEIFAPIGISFYTFRVIGHLIDVYNNKVKVPNIFDYYLYVTYFPQILSGPIMRPQMFYNQLKYKGKIRTSSNEIIILFLSGFIKKFLISSLLWDYSQAQFSNPIGFSSIDLIIGILAYSCMIYTDFSGYSDLSIAVSKLLGIEVEANFNSPYRSIGLKDFWSRWHISLSTWLKDYVYIPLGGSRNFLFFKTSFISKISFIPNILITMIVSGIWHGAGYTFIVWGALHGIGSIITHMVDKFKIRTNLILNFFGWLVTFVFINITWVFFNSKSVEIAISYLSELYTTRNYNNAFFDFKVVTLIALVLIFNFIGRWFYNNLLGLLNKFTFHFIILLLVIIVYVIIKLGPELMPPFIYFSF